MNLHDHVAAWLNHIAPPIGILISRVGHGPRWAIHSGPDITVEFESNSGPLPELELMLELFQDVVMSNSTMRWPDSEHGTSPEVQTRSDGLVSRVGYCYGPAQRRQWVAWLEAGGASSSDRPG